MSRRSIVFAAVPLGLALLGGASPQVPSTAARVAPPSAAARVAPPPDGTYVYELSRNGTVRGRTTLVLGRRNGVVEIAETGGVGAANASVRAAYAEGDGLATRFEATYRAPFLRSWTAGLLASPRPHDRFYDRTTIQYRPSGARLLFDIDGVPGAGAVGASDGGKPVPAWVFDAPFMSGVVMLPAWQARANAGQIVAFSAAFAPDPFARTLKIERAVPQFSGTPRTDRALVLAGLATIWFDPATGIVHEAHFGALNIDARLVASGRTAPSPAAEGPAPTPQPSPPASEVTIPGDGGPLAGSLSRPNDSGSAPGVVLVPPGPHASRNFDPEGPNSAFVTLADALVARGFAVLRYDTRGVGASGGSQNSQTWEASAADAEAAVRYLQGADGIDAEHVYVVGYGSGADFAFDVASSPNISESVAGVVALAPTVLPYRECLQRDRRENVSRAYRLRGLAPPPPAALDAGSTDGGSSSAILRSYLARDPVPVDVANRAPALVFHPGKPTCGETAAERAAFDDGLTIANQRTSIALASDLSARFGNRDDADSLADTQALFPYRLDPSTVAAIVDWLANPKPAGKRSGRGIPAPSRVRSAPPPPPPPPRFIPAAPTAAASPPTAAATPPSAATPPLAATPPPTLPSFAPIVPSAESRAKALPGGITSPAPTPSPTPKKNGKKQPTAPTPSPSPSPTASPKT